MDKLEKMISETFKEKTVSKVLDVGTGRGSFVEVLTNCFDEKTEIIGIDTSEKAIEMASQGFKDNKNVSFYNMNASKMTFEDDTFDIVCISNTLHHLPNMFDVLNEMKRVVKEDGYFIIMEMYCDNQSVKQETHVFLHHLAGDIDGELGVCHKNTFKRQEIIEFIKEIGMDVEKAVDVYTHEDQLEDENIEEEKERVDLWINALKGNIKKISEQSLQDKYNSILEEKREELYKNGFFSATELLLIGKN